MKEEWRWVEGISSFTGVEETVSAALSTEEFHLSYVAVLVTE